VASVGCPAASHSGKRNILVEFVDVTFHVHCIIFCYNYKHSQDELFLDKEGGAYFNTPGEDPSVLLRVKEDYDGAEPSGNSMAAINMIRLSSIFDAAKSEGYKRNVEHLLVCTYLVYVYMHYTTAVVWFQNMRFTLYSSIKDYAF
jgi:uncharacterized protein YyaL (SSP411 family)